MQNTMNIAELYHLYKYISERLEENGDAEVYKYDSADEMPGEVLSIYMRHGL